MTLLPRWNNGEVHGGGLDSDLSGEADPSIYYQDLFTRAQELAAAGKGPTALHAFQEISQQKEFPQLAEEAQSSMNVLLGGGPWELQLEHQVRELPDHFFHAPTLLGMAAGGVAYRLGRGFAIGRLLGSKTPALMEAAGIRLASGMAGMALEVPAFAGTAHLLSGAREGTFRDHLSSTGITLGALRSFGWIGAQVGKLGAPRLAGLGGMYAGILSAQALDPTQSNILRSEGLSPWLQGLVTLAQFQAAGAAYRWLAPKRLQNWERHQDRRAEQALANSLTQALRPPPGNSLAWQMAGAGAARIPSLRPQAHDHIVLSKADPKFSREAVPISKTVEGFLSSVPEFLAHDINLIYREMGRDTRVLRMLTETGIQDLKLYQRGVHRLASALEHSFKESGRGTYLDWMMRQWLEQVVPEMKTQRLDGALKLLARGTSLRKLEKYLAEDLPLARLPGPQYDIDLSTPYEHHERKIDDLKIDPEARAILRGWSREEERTPDPDIKIPPPKYFFLKISPHHISPTQSKVLEAAVHLMAASPLGKFRLIRLSHLFDIPSFDAHWDAKLRELADPHFALTQGSPTPPPKDLKAFSHSQWDAYLGGETAALLHQFAQRAPMLAHPRNLSMRRNRRMRILEEFIREKQASGTLREKFAVDDLAQLFEKLGDEVSKIVARDLKSKKVDVEIHFREGFHSRLRELGIEHPEKRRASFHHALDTGTGRSLILFRQPDFSSHSPKAAARLLTALLQDGVHETRHFRDYEKKIPKSPTEMLHVEMRGYTEEALWASEHGSSDFLVDFHRHSSLGFGQYLRNCLEANGVGVVNYPTRR
ncbi:MAG: hypothetical protein R3257_04500 [bacterium]|nr:hypothetical protein [bacterium]